MDPTPTNDTTPTFSFNSPDATASFQCSVDNAAFAACTSPRTVSPALAAGAHNIRVRAIDTAGNIDATPAVRNFTIDLTPPDTAITGGPTGPTSDTTPTFTFNSPDATATFQRSVDNAAFVACTSPRTTVALADGAHNFRVRAVDTAGNIDVTPAQRAFSVETSAPEHLDHLGAVEPDKRLDAELRVRLVRARGDLPVRDRLGGARALHFAIHARGAARGWSSHIHG